MIKATRSILSTVEVSANAVGQSVTILAKGVNELDLEVDCMIEVNAINRTTRLKARYVAAGIEHPDYNPAPVVETPPVDSAPSEPTSTGS